MSTTATGNAFRDRVCSLLRTKYPDAQVEERIAGTKVDIRFTVEDDFGGRNVYAVECKDYARPLTKEILAKEIRPFYQPMLEGHQVDQVLIVSSKPLGADAHEFMKAWRNATHKTYDELAESLLGLRPYIEDLAKLKPTDDMAYVEARFAGESNSAVSHLDQWIESRDGQGLAIRGSYGQGKTSFARHLASLYAQRHLLDPAQRMPVLYRLGEVTHESRLEALFGAMFTAEHTAKGYRFSTFEHLNRAGRLLVIFDGFDEMKHAMTAADFFANFREFNRLLKGDAKVVLLGRPNALPSDVEELVFRGKSDVAGQKVASSIYLPWKELKLDFFTAIETKTLLTDALGAFVQRHSQTLHFQYSATFVPDRVAEILNQVPDDLLRRPVHVNLVADLGADPHFNFSGFNEFKLYDHFIRKMVERDVAKKPRRAIPVDARLAFQREVAWWAWSRTGASQGYFLRKDIPPRLLEGLPVESAADNEGALNEYIVTTLTEEKESGALFFAHRSFQEFLVAERARNTVPTPASMRDYSTYLTADVMSFLKQAPEAGFVFSWYETLRGSPGPFSNALLVFLSTYTELVQYIRSQVKDGSIDRLDPWTVSILALSQRDKSSATMTRDEFMRFAANAVRQADSRSAAAAALAMLMIYKSVLVPALMIDIAAALIERCLRRCRVESTRDSITFDRGMIDFSSTWLSSAVSKHFPRAGETRAAALQFDVGRLEEYCAAQLATAGQPNTPDAREHPLGTFFPGGTVAPVSVEAQRVYDGITKDVRDRYIKYLQASKPNFPVADVRYAVGGSIGRRIGAR